MAWWLLLSALVLCGVADPCAQVLGHDNDTCILAPETCSLDWGKDLILPENFQPSKSCASMELSADRVMLQSGARLELVKLKISARSISFDHVRVDATTSILLLEKDTCASIKIFDTQLWTRSMVINCPNGTVEATAKSFLQVAYGTLAVRAKEISFPDFLVQLICNAINLNSDYLTFRARILQGAQLQALSRVGQADLGWVGGTWRLESFVLGAQSVVFASDFRVEVLGDSCGDGYLKMWDYCEQYLKHSWPWSQSFFDHVKDMGAPNVSFTTVIFAQHTLRLTTRSRVLSGLAFFCAGDELVLEDSSAIISKGRGCPAGEGAGAGELRTHFGECGGAGASNAGAGGDGALRLKGAELWHCAEKGLVAPPQPGLLPLFGASGGGCCSCPPNTRLEYSSGGGALWLSSSVLSLGRSSLISADGLPGGMVPGPQVMTNPGMVASGGGAGGQILISIKDLKLLAPAPLPETTATTTDPGGAPEDEGDQPPKLTATGGAAQCISARKSVGGAGGGGFIGLWWRSLPSAPGKGGKGRKHRGATTHEELEDRVTLDVSGGPLTETCEDVLPQQLHQEVAGADGLAISLTTCPLGRAGAFCAACPVGHWGDGVHCMSCTNKPNPSAFYVRNAWPNASCPYYCALGVPEVVINPKCLSNYAFAASFFGGEMGFWSFLLCPVSIFLILRTAQWLRRKRKRTLGRWQFPREELPCHLGRIFLLGDNSPGSPWRLPHMSTTGAAAQAAQALAPEGWQVLEESLAKPLKIPSWESWRLFRWSPWSQLLLRKMRRARARRAERAVRLLRGELTLWKDAGDDGSKPCIKFDCDDSATTGYLDLFDFRRSGMDWAPGNLKEEQILVAQGAGSWARPYELNVGDPLLLGVAQSQGPRGPIGSHLIYSLVCTFNLFSRLVPTQELLEALWDGEAPALTLLQSEVEKAARSLSLPAAVQVQIFRMSRGPRAGPGGEDAASAAQSPDSFTDLVHPVPLAPAPVEVEEDLKLCLVLRSGRGDQGLLHSDSGSELEMRLPKEPHGFCARVWRTLLRLCNRRLHAWAWRTANLGVSSLLISLIFFMLILFEGMVSAILVSTFHRLGIGQASGVYLLLPCPLAPLSPLMGLAALVLRRPFLGRLQAQLSLMAVINVVVVGTLYWMPGLLAPLLASGLLHVLVSYFAAIFSGLEMSNADLVMAEDSGDATLASIREASLRAAQTNREEEGICMAILPGRRRARSRADSVESDAPGEQEHGGATPF